MTRVRDLGELKEGVTYEVESVDFEGRITVTIIDAELKRGVLRGGVNSMALPNTAVVQLVGWSPSNHESVPMVNGLPCWLYPEQCSDSDDLVFYTESAEGIERASIPGCKLFHPESGDQAEPDDASS